LTHIVRKVFYFRLTVILLQVSPVTSAHMNFSSMCVFR